MSLTLPDFPVERLTRSSETPADELLALVERDGNRDVVQACTAAARAEGVRIGQTAAAARALCTTLEIRPVDPEADAEAMASLAAALQWFTPDVCLDGPGALLLEIGRTTIHFGGERHLVLRARDLCTSLGYHAWVGVAPTPGAARLLARAGEPGPRRAYEEDMVETLSPLPWQVLGPEPEVADAFRALGLRTVGDVLKLPAAGVIARFGEAFAAEIDCILGRCEEPLERFEAPEGFAEKITWWPPTDDVNRLVFVAKRLLDQAEAFLSARRCGLQHADLVLGLAGTKETVTVALRPSRAASESAALLRLLRHRLESLEIPGQVESLELVFASTVSLVDEQLSLFEEEPEQTWEDDVLHLCDRLTGRLGEEGVMVATLTAEHRPEEAWQWRRPAAAEQVAESDSPYGLVPAGRRPVELDDPPVPLAVEVSADGVPLSILGGPARGALKIASGPERIEAGWWDGNDARRLYFEVETRSGSRLWMFHDLDTGLWFRHGLFS